VTRWSSYTRCLTGTAGTDHIQVCTNISRMLAAARSLWTTLAKKLGIGMQRVTRRTVLAQEVELYRRLPSVSPALQVNYEFTIG